MQIHNKIASRINVRHNTGFVLCFIGFIPQKMILQWDDLIPGALLPVSIAYLFVSAMPKIDHDDVLQDFFWIH